MTDDNRTKSHSTKAKQRRTFMAYFIICTFLLSLIISSSSNSLPDGFVYVRDLIPDIQISLRYASDENFQGHIVNGYLANVSILTRAATLALKEVQTKAKSQGFELVIYDGYRPQKSVNQFVNWSESVNINETKKSFYYPRVNRNETFQLGYIAKKSGHTRGSTIDLTIISSGKRVQNPLNPIQRNLSDDFSIFYLDDGTVDMGSSFDLFDQASHTNSTLVNGTHHKRRMYLKNLMDQAGFDNYANEWWHYTLRNEPFPDTYFDFDIQSSATGIDPNRCFLAFISMLFFSFFRH